ncbi:MAG: glycosyltransferase family 4 protein [Campylobacterales bacterium]|nr:glycosyltransferase family 4 protein [Campylobacterales bacterium]MBD3795414.1 glycosyltransferase family 4 protein [Campylobacterota bacterium]
MKIAYLVPYIAQSGPVNVVKYLCRELKKKHDVDVFYFKDIKSIEFPVKANRIGFFEKIDFDAYDIIHSHGVVPDAYVWWHRKSIHKAKTVTTLHNYVKEDFKYAYNPMKAFLLEKVWNIVTSKHDQIVTLSKDAVKYYQKFWKNKKLDYVYNGIPSDVDILVHEKQFDKDNLIKIGVIGSGDITKRKGFDQVVQALKYLKNYSFYIAGTGQQVENLKQLAKEYGVEERVFFTGFQKNIALFIDAMDLFVVPSRSEGFSLALQEIARQKKPVVCSNIPIFQELFSKEEVIYFELENINDLCSAIEAINEKKDSYGEKIFQKFNNTYTSAVMADHYLMLYSRIIKDGSK